MWSPAELGKNQTFQTLKGAFKTFSEVSQTQKTQLLTKSSSYDLSFSAAILKLAQQTKTHVSAVLNLDLTVCRL